VIKTASPEVDALYRPLYVRAIQLVDIAGPLAVEADRLRTELDAAKARGKPEAGSSAKTTAYDRAAVRLDALSHALETALSTVVDARARTTAELCETAKHAASDLDLFASAASEVDAMTRD